MHSLCHHYTVNARNLIEGLFCQEKYKQEFQSDKNPSPPRDLPGGKLTVFTQPFFLLPLHFNKPAVIIISPEGHF